MEEIRSVKCKKCRGISLLEIYNYYFVCQYCGARYIFDERD